MNYNIRTANISDLDFINASRKEMHDDAATYNELVDLSVYYEVTPIELTAPDRFFYIVEDETMARAGFMELRLITHGMTRVMHVGLIYTTPGYRKQGIATMLMDKAKSLGASIGCKQLQLSVLHGNEAAHSFYKHYGFKYIKHTVGISLETNEK